VKKILLKVDKFVTNLHEKENNMFLAGISNNLTGENQKTVMVVMVSEEAVSRLEKRIQHWGGAINTFTFDYWREVSKDDARKYTFIRNNDICIKFLFETLYPEVHN